MKFAPIAYKLSNGIPVILDPMDIATTGMTVSFGVGARDEAPHEYGITHFLEHMLCKGTQRFPSPRLLKDNVFVNGGESNASTSTDEMQFYGRMLAEKFHVLAESISDRLQNSLFDEKVLENERGVILDELGRSRNSMDNQFYRHTVENVLVNTGFAHPTLGTPENIKSFSRTQVIDYMRRNISAKNAIIGISGKIDNPDALISSLEKLYGWIPSIDVAAPVPITVTPTVAHKSSPGKENIKLGIGFQDVWPWGLKNRYANKCVSIFENTFSGRLYENIRNQAGLVYGIGMSSFGDEFVTVNTIDTECARDKIESVVAKIAKTVNEVMITKP
ncbi:MAG: insulinase family protein, partial [Alphaproteobacteria bacterium]|nr:insulinase family protein [Alphaproteobacteria bacterium]